MNRPSAWNVTSVLCVLLLGACASTAPNPGKVSAISQTAQPAAPAPDSNSDVATIAKDLPGTLDGEVRRAQLLRSKGDFEDASRSLAQLMLVAPDDPRVVGEYGKVLAQQGHAEAAIPFLVRAVELQPKDWTLYSALGVVYDQSDDHTKARQAYEHALTLAPGQTSVLNNYAVSRMLAGDLGGAQHLLSEASAKGAGNPKIENNVAKLASLKGAAPQVSQKVASASTETRPAPRTASREAVAPPKGIVPAVIMQTVPADPMAGPVKSRTLPHPRLAHSVKPKPQVAHASAPPALRTAAEAN
jgi:Flp pilus assembly protein TadD